METFNPNLQNKIKNFKKKAKRVIPLVVLVILVLVLGGGAFYNIEEQEQAVITTFGVAHAESAPGLHFKIPLVQSVRKVNTTIQGMALGYDQASNESTIEDSLMITRDYNFVNVDFFIEYQVADPVKAVYASQNPQQILENISKSCIRTVIGSYDVDSVLTTGKNEIQASVRDMIITKLEEHEIGLQVVNVTIQDSEPPTTAVMEAFKSVETAKQGKETALNNANKYRNEKLPQAAAEIDKIMQDAESIKAQRVNEANAEVAKFNAVFAEYMKNPEVTKKRMFYEAMEDILPNLKVIIDGTDKTSTILPLDSFTAGTQSVTGAQAAAPGESEAAEGGRQ